MTAEIFHFNRTTNQTNEKTLSGATILVYRPHRAPAVCNRRGRLKHVT